MKEKTKTHFAGFMNFIREQGVMGLAIGFILGGSVSKVVTSLVQDIIYPILGILLGATDGLAKASFKIASIEIMWGHFVSVLLDFVIIALVVYVGFKVLGLDKLDKKKDAK